MKRKQWSRAVDAFINAGYVVCNRFDSSAPLDFWIRQKGRIEPTKILTLRALDIETVAQAIRELQGEATPGPA